MSFYSINVSALSVLSPISGEILNHAAGCLTENCNDIDRWIELPMIIYSDLTVFEVKVPIK